MAEQTNNNSNESPVLSVITKRLRSLHKKHRRITDLEQTLTSNPSKPLNKEQQDLLNSKPTLLSLIDELEKLKSPLSLAIQQELNETKKEELPNSTLSHPDVGIKDLLNLLYFGGLFDVKSQSEYTSTMLTRVHERGCCLTYDYVADDASDDSILTEKDLDLISGLQGLILSRPGDSTLSHQMALDKCVDHAKLWLDNAHQPIAGHSDVTYAALREKLNRIMSSKYFTTTPEMKGAEEVAAAAAVGNFGSFVVPIHEPVHMPHEVPVQGEVPAQAEVPVPAEESVGQYQEMEENSPNHEQYGTENPSGTFEDFQQNDLEPENHPEVVTAQSDQEHPQAEGEGYNSAEFKEQQYVPRGSGRGRGGRGGRRGGYPNGRGGRGNGRGGGPYQNGRNQYYDNYYPRNNYYHRRGGRSSGGGGGNSYYNQSSVQGNDHAQANVGVAS